MSINYPGDVTEAIEADIASKRAMGPNYLGELMWPTGAIYNADLNRTEVAFTFVNPGSAS